MILVYTGEGKGKTSACTGQAIRALGAGLDVAFGQFMKKSGEAGEQELLASLPGLSFKIGGLGFFTSPDQFPAHRQAALELLDWAVNLSPRPDLLILDEALYALNAKLITREELQPLLATCSGAEAPHLLLSGRGLPDWLRDTAQLVTEMAALKHPYTQGITAQKGIEF